MKKIRRIVSIALCAFLLCAGSMTVRAAETGYTYRYDWWGDVQYSPDAYKTVGVYTSVELGLDAPLKNPQGLFIYGRNIYICDTGNNRILELERDDADTIRLLRVIDSIKGDAEVKTFNYPTDIAVTDDGFMFVSDMNNNRIVKMDMDTNYIMEFTKPLDSTFDQNQNFLPSKIAVDTAGRVYCVASHVNRGLIKYENDGNFSGFIGATPVTYNWTDYIWKRLATQEQRAQMENFVPTEYDNLYMDYEGFIYACTTNVEEDDLDSGAAKPVRKLNLMGSDILVQNSDWPVIGDLYWGEGGGVEGPSLMIDLTAMENDIYFCLDKTRGRIFSYDDQGRMLYCFGGRGNINGYFKQPIGIDHMGHDLFVLDSLDCSITLFTPTEYGNLMFNAIEQFQSGLYEESGESWQGVMDLNGNCDLAYIGIGRSLLRQERYHEAMEYFKLKLDDENYSKAFKQYRKEWVEEHIIIIFSIVFLLLVVPLAINRVKEIKRQIDKAGIV